MYAVNYTLLTDGSSDAALIPIIDWLLEQRGAVGNGQMADLRVLSSPPKTLASRVEAAIKLYSPEVLFVHRDAEGQPWGERKREIDAVTTQLQGLPCVAVIPVTMTEAWLVHDEAAIRRASGNPNGANPLTLPKLSRLEGHTDPKATLRQALEDAAAARGRRRRRRAKTEFGRNRAAVARFIEDFGPLRVLPAFQALEQEIVRLVQGTAVAQTEGT